MNLKKKKKINILPFFMGLIVLLFASPFYLAFLYAFKSQSESAIDPLGFPEKLNFDNFINAIRISNFPSAFKNSVIVTVCATIIVVAVSSLAAYVIARNFKNKFYSTMYYIFIASIMVPFQVIMFPIYKMMYNLQLVNTLFGLIITLVGFQIGFNVFLYVGFIKSIPLELEEAANIDGCNMIQTFLLVIFPLLKPTTMTVIVLSALGFWNDFVVSIVLVQKEAVSTLPLTQYRFIGQYSVEINMAFAAVILSMIPLFVLYLAAQKYIIAGVTAGAIKG